MARHPHCTLVGDLTGDIVFDTFRLDGGEVPRLRFDVMVDSTAGAARVQGVLAYGPLAELCRGRLRKGSRVFVRGHITRRTREGRHVVEVVAEKVDVTFGDSETAPRLA